MVCVLAQVVLPMRMTLPAGGKHVVQLPELLQLDEAHHVVEDSVWHAGEEHLATSRRWFAKDGIYGSEGTNIPRLLVRPLLAWILHHKEVVVVVIEGWVSLRERGRQTYV